MCFGYDEELPGGFQDADFEQRALEDAANASAARRRRGICDHGWTQGPPGQASSPTTVWTCLDCGKVFQTEAELRNAQAQANGR